MSDIMRLSLPLTAWLAAFSAVYGLGGLVCSDRWAQAGLSLATGRGAMIAAWLAAIAVQVALVLAIRSPRVASPSAPLQRLSLTLAIVALAATVWSLLPVVATSMCVPRSP